MDGIYDFLDPFSLELDGPIEKLREPCVHCSSMDVGQ